VSETFIQLRQSFDKLLEKTLEEQSDRCLSAAMVNNHYNVICWRVFFSSEHMSTRDQHIYHEFIERTLKRMSAYSCTNSQQKTVNVCLTNAS